MKNISAVFVLLFLPSLCFAKSKDCDETFARTSKVNGEEGHVTYEQTREGFHFKVGGMTEQFIGIVDREAIKRAIVSCTPGFARCLKENNEIKRAGEVMISFDLALEKEKFQVSQLQTSSQSYNAPALHTCFQKMLSQIKFSAVTGGAAAVKVKVPLRLE
jgi:hypothetical protein